MISKDARRWICQFVRNWLEKQNAWKEMKKKVKFVFQISQSPKKIQKNYPELEIWNSCPYQYTTYSNFKLRIVFWTIFWWDWEIWRTNLTFWKKATFNNGHYLNYGKIGKKRRFKDLQHSTLHWLFSNLILKL